MTEPENHTRIFEYNGTTTTGRGGQVITPPGLKTSSNHEQKLKLGIDTVK